MARFDAFCAGSYTAPAWSASMASTKNLYPERIEDPAAASKTDWILRDKPGLEAFAGDSGALALTEMNGRAFAVGKLEAAEQPFCFYEVWADGSTHSYGAVATDARPQLAASETEVLLLSGGLGYVFTLATSTLARIEDPDFPYGANQSTFIDGYFIVLEPNSQKFAISGMNAGSSWDALDYGDVEGQAGNAVALLADHRMLWILCRDHSEPYYNSGAADFPFSRLQGAHMQQGCVAMDTALRHDNTIFWLGRNEGGAGVCWRANGYTPQRVSTHATEAIWQSYPTLEDARAFSYQEDGHLFYVLTFPSANDGRGATWVYDVASGFWHERGSWNATLDQWSADLAQCHMYAFGKHLVSGPAAASIYEQSSAYHSDDGAPILRERVCPDLANGGNWTYYSELRLLLQTGVGLDGAAGGTSGGGTGGGTPARPYTITSAGDGAVYQTAHWSECQLPTENQLVTNTIDTTDTYGYVVAQITWSYSGAECDVTVQLPIAGFTPIPIHLATSTVFETYPVSQLVVIKLNTPVTLHAGDVWTLLGDHFTTTYFHAWVEVTGTPHMLGNRGVPGLD